MSEDEETTTAVSIRKLLVRGVRGSQGRRLCKDEPGDTSRGAQLSSYAATSYLALTLMFIVSYQFNWSAVGSFLAVFALVLLGAIVTSLGGATSQSIATVVLLLDLAGFFYLAFWKPFLLSTVFGTPALVVVLLFSATRAAKAASALPLFLAAALIVVLAPLLTEDPWRLAPAAASNFPVFATIAIVPLGALVLVRIIRIDPLITIIQATRTLCEKHDSAEKTANRVEKLAVQGEQPECSGSELVELFSPVFSGDADHSEMYTAMYRLKGRFRTRTIFRYVFSLAGFAASAFAVIFIIAWSAVPPTLAGDWAQTPVSYYLFSVNGWGVHVPVTPYVDVAVLFSIVATAAYLAFCASDEKYLESVLASVAAKPAERLAMFALPYYHVYVNRPDDVTASQ